MALRKIQTRSQTVTEKLRDLIVREELRPGEHLQEQPLAESLGVSRTPLRTALSTLASEGVLDYRPKRGYVVREFQVGDVVDAWQMRAWLEGLAALRAAERGLGRDAEARLENAVTTGDRILSAGALKPGDLEAYRQMNVDFHDTVIDAAASPRLADTIRRTLNIPMVSNRIVPWNDYEHIKRSHDDHHRVLEAILAREAWRAEALMREHIFSGVKRLAGLRPGERPVAAE